LQHAVSYFPGTKSVAVLVRQSRSPRQSEEGLLVQFGFLHEYLTCATVIVGRCLARLRSGVNSRGDENAVVRISTSIRYFTGNLPYNPPR
jgi:hypothetical protein